MSQKPMVGDTVYYFTDLVACPPMAAIVTMVYSEDIVNLQVTDGDRWFAKKSVHWRECKAVKENPQIVRQCGAWGFRPTAAERQIEALRDQEVERQDRLRGSGGKFQKKVEKLEEELSPI